MSRIQNRIAPLPVGHDRRPGNRLTWETVVMAVAIPPHALVSIETGAARPIAQIGLGLSAVATEALAAGFETDFPLVEDTPDMYPAWKGVVAGLTIIGKQVHDARLVAVCHAHAITHMHVLSALRLRLRRMA